MRVRNFGLRHKHSNEIAMSIHIYIQLNIQYVVYVCTLHSLPFKCRTNGRLICLLGLVSGRSHSVSRAGAPHTHGCPWLAKPVEKAVGPILMPSSREGEGGGETTGSG